MVEIFWHGTVAKVQRMLVDPKSASMELLALVMEHIVASKFGSLLDKEPKLEVLELLERDDDDEEDAIDD